jgi:hypothetical protein
VCAPTWIITHPVALRPLNDFERQSLKSGDPRWRNTAHWTRSQLVQRGMLSHTSPRGTWEITPEGRKYLEEKKGPA